MNEMRFIAEVDCRIPLEYDPDHTFAKSSIDSRLEFYYQLAADDFFEVVAHDKTIVAFHIVKKGPYPPDFQVGNIITLWVHPNYRGQQLAFQLKSRAEHWARHSGLILMQTSVHKDNQRMLQLNEESGYELAYLNMRKKL